MADIELLFGVLGGGEVSGQSGSGIQRDLNKIVEAIEPLKVKVQIDIDGSSGKWQSDLGKLVGSDKNGISLKVSKIDTSGALSSFKSDLQNIVNSISLDKGTNISIKGLGVGDIATDLKQVGKAAKDSADDVSRIKAEIKALNAEGSSIDALYKGLTKATNIKNSAAEIDVLKQKYVELGTAMDQMESAGATSSNAYIEKVKVLQSEIKELIKSMSVKDATVDLEKSLSKTTNLLAELTRVESQWTAARSGKSSGAYNQILEYKNQIIDLTQALNSGNMTQKEFDKAFDSISAGAKTAKKQIQSVGEATKSLPDKMGSLFGKLGQWITVNEAIYKSIQAIQKMIDCVVKIDTAMTELKKVTDVTESTYDRFLNNAMGRARELGAAVSDVVTASADFARLGFSIDDASKLADTAILYKNVADGIDDISVASKSITSTMQAFGINVNDAVSIVDKFNEVSNNYAISSAGLGEALQRSAAALNAGGNTLDQSIAMITAANRVIQAPETVGTTMKTVSMYLRSAKTELEAAGESTDGMVESTSKLRKEILQLTGNKVDIQIDDGQFKSTYDILKELSQVWDELTDITQANILEKIGGKRNANVVAALIGNFDEAEDIIKTSANSAGSALEENAKYLDSIAGRIERLKSSFEALSTSVVDSGLSKTFISIADVLLQIAKVITDISFDNLFSGIATIAGGGALTAFFKNIDSLKEFGEASTSIQNIFKVFDTGVDFDTIDGMYSMFDKSSDSIRKLSLETVLAAANSKKLSAEQMTQILSVKGLTAEQIAQTLAMQGYSKSVVETALKVNDFSDDLIDAALSTDDFAKAMGSSSGSIGSLGAAFSGLATKIGISTTALAGLSIALAVFTAAAVGVKLYNQHIQESVDVAREAGSAWENTSNALSDQAARVEELRTALDSGTLSEQESYNAKAELLSIQQSLVASYGNQAAGIDLINGKIKEEISLINELSAAQANQFLNENKTGIDKAISEMEKSRTISLGRFRDIATEDVKALKDVVAKYSDYIELVEVGGAGGIRTSIEFTGDAEEAKDVINSLMTDLRNISADYEDSSLFDMILGSASSQLSDVNAILENYQSIYDQAKQAELISDPTKYAYQDQERKAIDWVNDYTEAVENYNNALISGDPGKIADASAEFASIDAAMTALAQGGMAQYAEQIAEIREQLNTAAIARSDFLGSLYNENWGFADSLKDSGLDNVDLMAAFDTDGLQEGEVALNALIDAAIRAGFVTDNSSESVQKVIDLLVEAGFVAGQTSAQIAAANSVSKAEFEIINTSIDSFQSKLSSLSGNLTSLRGGTLSLENVIDLVQQFPELAEYVDLTAEGFGNLEEGLENLIKQSPDSVIQTLQELKNTKNLTDAQKAAIDGLCQSLSNMSTDAIKDASGEFGVLAASINAAKKAQTELDKALSEDDYDAGYDKRIAAFEGFQEVIKNGEFGSKAFAAYKDYFGLEDMDSAGIKEWMANNKKYFAEGQDGILAFLKTVEQLSTADQAFAEIASYDSSTGAFWYDINALSQFADKLGWSEEMLQDFIDKYRMYCEEWESRSAQDNLTEFTNQGLIFETNDGAFASLQQLMDYTHLSQEEVLELVDAMNQLREQEGFEPIQIIGSDQVLITQQVIDSMLQAGHSAEEIKQLILDLEKSGKLQFEAGIKLEGQTVEEMLATELGNDGANVVSVNIDFNINDEAVSASITTTEAELQRVFGRDWRVVLNCDDNANSAIDNVGTKLKDLDGDKAKVYVNNSVGTTISNLSTIVGYLKDIQRLSTQEITITDNVDKNARGTSHATEGPSLLGDEYSPTGAPKPELVVSSDGAYIAGLNGPELGYLHDGDVVYNADDTKKILNGQKFAGTIQAHAGGTANGLIGNSSGGYGSGGGNSPINSGATTVTGSSKFEELYEYHQHLIAMDKETIEEYLEWLEDAYKEAYEKGEISKEDYWKYAEEVYEKLKELFNDFLNDAEHKIDLIINEGGSNQEIIAIYQQLMESIVEEINAAKEAGLDENHEYIQELQNKWWDYQKEIQDIQDEITKNAMGSVDDLVDYRVDMLKQDLENEKDVINERLEYLRDFYQKQKDMLQATYDEEKYLKEQSEKRTAISDIEAELDRLKLDDSAKAQKRRQELLAELADAQEALNEFEKDHILENTQKMLDDLLASQEEGLNAEIDSIDDQLNDAKSLYEQALADVRNGSVELYEEMIAYNAQYGSGIDDEITQMWESAYVSLQKYFELFKEYYKGINLPNVTGYVPVAVDGSAIRVESGYARGTTSATPGIHGVDENGAEYVFTSSDGSRYRVFSGGEKVLNAKATNFLYDFATSGGEVLSKLFDGVVSNALSSVASSQNRVSQIVMGDIIVQGNANQETVSAIRREKREEMQWILREFNKMNKRT